MNDVRSPASEKQQVIKQYTVTVGSKSIVPWYPYSRVLDVKILPGDATTLHFWIVHPIWVDNDAPFTRVFYVLDTGMPFPITDVAEGSAVGEEKTEGGVRVWQLIRSEPLYNATPSAVL
jgi:hypothetical protein